MNLLFLIASAICFTIAILLATAVFTGSSYNAWVAGGLLAFVLAQLVGAGLPAIAIRRDG